MSNRRGTISLNTLLALMIVLICLPITITIFKYCASINYEYTNINNELALYDLRKILLLSYDLQVFDNELAFIYQDQNYRLYVVNEHLILQPGTQIYIDKVIYAAFKVVDGNVLIEYQDDLGRDYESVLCKKESLYLADFSSDYQYSEYDNDNGY